MLAEYDVWFQDPMLVLCHQLGNPDFKDKFDYAPYQKFDNNGEQEWKDVMESASLGFCPSPKVSYLYIYLPSVLTAVFPKLIENIKLMPNFACFTINCFTHLLALFLNPYDQ